MIIYMELIMNLLLMMTLCLTLGFLNSLLSYFLDFCFYPNSIFGRWLPWLADKLANWSYKEDLKKLPTSKEHGDQYDRAVISLVENNFLYKILGGCITCSNVWQSMMTFNLLFFIGIYNFGFSGWYYFMIFPYIFFSSFVLRKISQND